MVVAWGDRVGLRPFEDPLTDNEAERIYRWSSDENVLKWSGGAPTDLAYQEFREHLRNDRGARETNRRAFLVVTRTGELIGRVGIFAIDWAQKQGELGIVLGEANYWGKGYGRDTIKTLLRHIFQTTSLESINLFTFQDNMRAQRCFVACGFRVLGSSRRFSPDIGEFDGIEMEIARTEFLSSAASPTNRLNLPVSEEKP